jgi:hypothetical protein
MLARGGLGSGNRELGGQKCGPAKKAHTKNVMITKNADIKNQLNNK